ncbi:MAG TPA: APC family permease [Blastocatellia bacterium]|jgi:amino acid transporter|nr:APC family permease [Blastocatellia bacterium]
MTDGHNTNAAAEFRREEERVEARSADFKKELGLSDLVLTQILFIVGLPWVGVAAKLGPAHIAFWLVAILLFYIPSAVVVIYLNRIMPLEGGLYQWAKLGFNELMGFLVAWNLWLFAILNMSEIGLQVTQYLGYIIGPGGDWLTGSKWFTGVMSFTVICFLVLLTSVGFGVGKWVHKAGGVMMLVTFAALLALPWLNKAAGSLAEYHPLRIEMPVLSLMSLNLLGKMGFGALGGFEYVAIHAGECRDPVRAISRSVALAAPLIAVMFILGTSSVLGLVPHDRIDLIAPIPQVLSEGFRPLGIVAAIAPLTIMALLCIRVAQASVMFAGNTRLPMVAGWDQLLPDWFTRLHATYKTPVNSVLFVGAATLALGVAGLIGVGKQEAFQLLWNASAVFYALTYLAMFAIPLVGLRGLDPRPPAWLKAAALSGFLMTLLFVALSIVPIIQVESRLVFALKISGLILITNVLGLAIFLAVGRKRQARQAAAVSAPGD